MGYNTFSTHSLITVTIQGGSPVKKLLSCIALIAAFTSATTLSFAAETSLITQSQIDKAISQYAPKSKPCPLWEKEYLGLRCVAIMRPGGIHGTTMRYLTVATQNDGLIVIQDGDRVHITPPEP